MDGPKLARRFNQTMKLARPTNKFVVVVVILLELLFGAPISSSQTGAQPQQRAQIQGQALNAITNEPVRKASVSLQRLEASNASETAVTDANGVFLLQNVEPGRYRLWAERTGYVRSGFGAKSVGSPGTVLVVDAGQSLRDLALKIMPQAVITGRVFDQDGEPVADVHVQALAFTYVRGKRQLMADGDCMTNDLGEYRIHGLAPNRYLISASYRPKEDSEVRDQLPGSERDAADFEETYAPTYYPNSTDAASATPISVSGGEQVPNLDLTLLRVRTGRIRGRINGRNVAVMLFPRDSGGIPMTDRNAATVSDSQGNFELRGVAPGSYILFAQSGGGSARAPVDVYGSNVNDVNLAITPNLEVRGRLSADDGAVRLGDRRSAVSLQPRDTPLNLLANTVKSDGTFLIANVPPDNYAVNFRNFPEGYFVKEIRIGSNKLTDGTLNLSGGSTAGYMDVLLSRSGGELSGGVEDAEAHPAAGATVTLVPEGVNRPALYLYQTTTTDQYGGFALKDIAPGNYQAYAWEAIDSGAYLDPDFLKMYKSFAASVTIEEKSHANVKLKLITVGSSQ
jgi:protocatechuate 3,4-dioxygenase beta subunit